MYMYTSFPINLLSPDQIYLYIKMLSFQDKKEDTIFLKIYVYFGFWLWVIELILHSIAEKLHHNRVGF